MSGLFYLIFNVILNLAIVLAVILVIKPFSFKNKKDTLTEKLLIGIIFAIGTIITMSFPLKISEGVILDSRSILINLSTFLFGEITGFIPAIVSTIYRAYIGGSGETGGIVMIILTYLISVYFYFLSKENPEKKNKYLIYSSFLIHIFIILLIFVFVREFFMNRLGFYTIIFIATVFPITTFFLGFIINESIRIDKTQKETEREKIYFKTLLNSIQETVLTTDNEFKIVFSNKKAKDFFNTNQLEGKNINEVIKIYDKNNNFITGELIEKAEKGKQIELTNCFIKKGVKTVPIEGYIFSLRKKGEKIGLLISFTDISEKIEREKTFSELLERISDGVESYDNNWNYTFANKKAATLLNRKNPEELIGKNKWKLEPNAIDTPFYNACIKAKRTGKPVVMEHYFEPWDRWFENRIYPSENGITVFFSDITEKKKLEQDLLKLNEQLKTIFKLNPAIIIIWDLETRKTLFVSENIETILGYTKEEAMQDIWWRNIAHPEDFENALSNSDIVYIEGQSSQKFRVYRKDGSIAWILEKQIVVEDNISKKKTVYGIWVDITDLISAEKRLKKQRKAFIHLFENEFVPMLLIDPENFRVKDANIAACTLYGYSKKEFKEKLTVFDLYSEQNNYSQIKEKFTHKLSIKAKHKKSNGEIIDIELYGIPFVLNGNEYIFAIIHDISEKERIEKELIITESKFFLAFQNSPIPTTITELKSGKFIDVNPAFEKVSGFKKHEVIGKTSVELNMWINPDERERFIEKLKKKAIVNEKVVFKNKKGKHVHTLFTSFLIENKFMFSYIIDISELIKLQTELELKVRERTRKFQELNEELREFTQSLVHDLKEPVRTIRNFSELILKEDKTNKSEMKNFINLINSASISIERMVNELYQYTKLGQERYTLSKVSLDNVFYSVIKMLDAKIKETNTRIIKEESLGMVYGNNTLITRVLLNILDNSIKFRKRDINPEITVNTKKTNSTLILIIEDNGRGIKKDYLNKIFFPFVKLHGKETEGIGMGLAIVKKSMELMGGEIEIKSREGKGTKVYLKFKL